MFIDEHKTKIKHDTRIKARNVRATLNKLTCVIYDIVLSKLDDKGRHRCIIACVHVGRRVHFEENERTNRPASTAMLVVRVAPLCLFVLSSFLTKKSKSIQKNKKKKNLQLPIIYIPTTENLGHLWEALRFQRVAVLEKAAKVHDVDGFGTAYEIG